MGHRLEVLFNAIKEARRCVDCILMARKLKLKLDVLAGGSMACGTRFLSFWTVSFLGRQTTSLDCVWPIQSGNEEMADVCGSESKGPEGKQNSAWSASRSFKRRVEAVGRLPGLERVNITHDASCSKRSQAGDWYLLFICSEPPCSTLCRKVEVKWKRQTTFART